MTAPLVPARETLPASPRHDWSWAAAHGRAPKPSAATVPEAEGGFQALIDTVNPLQQLPFIGGAYRGLTAAPPLSAPARILGGLIFGGVAGFLLGIGCTIVANAVDNGQD